MRADLWTDERVAALKLWWSEGKTGEAIAARLGGVSRSAVLGKIFRLRVAAAAAAAQSASGAGSEAAPDVASPPASPQPQPRRPRGKNLLELTNRCCRWPYGRRGSFFFCGEPGADLERGMPYCPRHARRAYRGSERFGWGMVPAAMRGLPLPARRRRRVAQRCAAPPRDREQTSMEQTSTEQTSTEQTSTEQKPDGRSVAR